MTIDLRNENERQKALGTLLGHDMDYIPGYDDGEPPKEYNNEEPPEEESTNLEEYDKANDR